MSALGGRPADICSMRVLRILTHCGHKLDRNPAAQQSPAVPRCAILSVGSTGGTGSETARVHLAARRRGGVAARGARAAGRADAAHRRAHAAPVETDADLQASLADVAAGRCSNWAATEGRNIEIDLRWVVGDSDVVRRHAQELIALAPDPHRGLWQPDRGARCKASEPHRPDCVPRPRRPGRALGSSPALHAPGGNATGFTPF